MQRIDDKSVAGTAVVLYLVTATVVVLLVSAFAHGRLQHEQQRNHCAPASADVEGVHRNDARPASNREDGGVFHAVHFAGQSAGSRGNTLSHCFPLTTGEQP